MVVAVLQQPTVALKGHMKAARKAVISRAVGRKRRGQVEVGRKAPLTTPAPAASGQEGGKRGKKKSKAPQAAPAAAVAPAMASPASVARRLTEQLPAAEIEQPPAAAVEEPLAEEVLEPPVAASVLVAVAVPDCPLAYGEHLRVVGSCGELGGWEPAAAPALTWHEGDTWIAELELPTGTHQFKLVVVKQDGSAYFEEGQDRTLSVPALPEASLPSESPAILATCAWRDTAATQLQCSTESPDHIQARMDAATAWLANLLYQRAQLVELSSTLEAEIAETEREVEELLATQLALARLQLEHQLSLPAAQR